MTLHWSAATSGFYDTAIFRSELPVDAVEITPARHAALMEALSSGRTLVAGGQGQPLLAPLLAPTLVQRQAAAVDLVRIEAERRILDRATLWRQSNDNAVIAAQVWRDAADLTSVEAEALAAALARRAEIDAIRLRSDAIEAAITGMSAADLDAFDATAASQWSDSEA